MINTTLQENNSVVIDILYKNSGDNKYRLLSDETLKDIALSEVIDYMTSDEEERGILRDIMAKIPLDPDDMIYRQDIIKDLLANDNLFDTLRKELSDIKILKYYGNGAKSIHDRDNSLASLLETLRELKVYVKVIESIYKALSDSDIKSEGFLNLRSSLRAIVEDEEFKSVKPDIEKIHNDLSMAKGAVIGVTLTSDMEIENVSAIEFVDYKPISGYTIMDMAVGSKIKNPFNNYKYQDPLLVAMTPHMKKHLGRHFGEIKQLIRKHSKYDSRILTNLYNGLVFYLNVVSLGKKLEARNCNTVFPEIKGAKGLDIKGLYNIRLVINKQEEIVKNDFVFNDKEKIYILTGPNRGGKTILEQGLGLLSVMTSLGMFITADSCSGLPFANILTHFPIDENMTINYGRLGEEAVRIREIVKEADDKTLILFNETFSTTSAADALFLAKDLLRILKEKGSYVVFNTHIHELAAAIPEMNTWDGSSDIISIVMEMRDDKNTFKVKRSIPDTGSYARNIAEKYGITYEQMKDM